MDFLEHMKGVVLGNSLLPFTFIIYLSWCFQCTADETLGCSAMTLLHWPIKPYTLFFVNLMQERNTEKATATIVYMTYIFLTYLMHVLTHLIHV